MQLLYFSNIRLTRLYFLVFYAYWGKKHLTKMLQDTIFLSLHVTTVEAIFFFLIDVTYKHITALQQLLD